MTLQWTPAQLRLKYLLGEFYIMTARFRSVNLDTHFSERGTFVDDDLPPLADVRQGLHEVATIRSYPIEASMPLLTFKPSGLIRYVPSRYQHAFIELTGTFDDYLKRFSAKTRSTLSRKVKKFAELSGGAIQWETFRDPAQMDRLHSLCREVSGKSYQEKLLNAGVPDSAAFKQTLLEKAGLNQVRGYILFHAGAPIAFLLCLAQGNVLFYSYVGYVPEFASLSPGNVLQYLALQSLFEEKHFRLFDFGEGEGPHKAFFSTGNAPCADVFYFRRTPRNVFLVMLHAGLLRLSAGITAIMDRLGVKAKLKKFFRRNM